MMKYVSGDEPAEEGKYLCWVNPDYEIPYAKQIMLMWMDGQWWMHGADAKFRDTVYGYSGPIPSLKLIK